MAENITDLAKRLKPFILANAADIISGGGGVTSVSASAPIVSSGGTSPAISINAATGATSGSMSAADKSKLDLLTLPAAISITGGGTISLGGFTLTVPASGTAVLGVTGTAPIVSSGGYNPAISISAATGSNAGSMSAADKSKLDLLTLPLAVSITGGGTIALGGFTLTVPATGTAALLARANAFTLVNDFSLGITLGTDVALSRKAADVAQLATGDSLQSASYTSGITGWNISADGSAEFSNVRVRGELASSVFKVSEIQATAGTFGVFKSASTTTQDVTLPALSGSFHLYVKTASENPTAALFAVNDILRVKAWNGSAITDSWLTVTAISSAAGVSDATCTLSSGTASAAIKAGTAVVDYGPGGSGFISLSSDGAVGSSANMSIATHGGSPWTSQTLLARLGNLNGSYGIAANTYGLGVGNYAGGNYLSYDGTSFMLKAGAGNVSIDGTGIKLNFPNAVLEQSAIRWMSSGAYRFSIDAYGTDALPTVFLTALPLASGTGNYSSISLVSQYITSGAADYAPQINITGNYGVIVAENHAGGYPTIGARYTLQVAGTQLVVGFTDLKDNYSVASPAFGYERAYSRNGMPVFVESTGAKHIMGGWASVMEYLAFTGNDMAAWYCQTRSNGYKDLMGGTYPLTLTGGSAVDYTALSTIVSGVRLNGTTGYYYNASLSTAMGANWLTFGCWFYRAATGRVDPLIMHGATTATHNLFVDATNQLVLNSYDATGTLRQFIVTTGIGVGWHFVAFRSWSDGSTTIFQNVYYDGTLYSKTHATANALRTPVGNFQLGSSSPFVSAFLSGDIGFAFTSKLIDYMTQNVEMIYRMTYPAYQGF